MTRILPDAPPPTALPDLAARVAALEHLAAQQAMALVAIETAMGNVVAAELSEADIQALEWIKALRRIMVMGV